MITHLMQKLEAACLALFGKDWEPLFCKTLRVPLIGLQNWKSGAVSLHASNEIFVQLREMLQEKGLQEDAAKLDALGPADPIIAPLMQAMIDYLKFIAVPIIYELPTENMLIGTGCFFDHDGRTFLTTARHLFDGVADKSKFRFPPNPMNSLVKGFGKCEIYVPKDKNIDIAVIQLLEDEVIAIAKKGYVFQALDIGREATKDATFVLAGYPSERTIQQGDDLGGCFMTSYTDQLTKTPTNAEQPVSDQLDLFLLYNNQGTDAKGFVSAAPKLHGLSGSIVWELNPINAKATWNAKAALSAIGIQSAYRRGEYARVKRWPYLCAMLRQICDGAVEEIDVEKL